MISFNHAIHQNLNWLQNVTLDTSSYHVIWIDLTGQNTAIAFGLEAGEYAFDKEACLAGLTKLEQLIKDSLCQRLHNTRCNKQPLRVFEILMTNNRRAMIGTYDPQLDLDQYCKEKIQAIITQLACATNSAP